MATIMPFRDNMPLHHLFGAPMTSNGGAFTGDGFPGTLCIQWWLLTMIEQPHASFNLVGSPHWMHDAPASPSSVNAKVFDVWGALERWHS